MCERFWTLPFGAQARVHGLMTQLARSHELTAVMLIDDDFDAEECRRAMRAFCREVVLVRNPYGRGGLLKRLLRLRSLASTRSFERMRVTVPALRQAPDRTLRGKRFDVINLEFPYLGHCYLRQAKAPSRATAARQVHCTHFIHPPRLTTFRALQ